PYNMPVYPGALRVADKPDGMRFNISPITPFTVSVNSLSWVNHSDSMALAAGTKLGPYEIIARIGAGVMGEATALSTLTPEKSPHFPAESCPASQRTAAPLQPESAVAPGSVEPGIFSGIHCDSSRRHLRKKRKNNCRCSSDRPQLLKNASHGRANRFVVCVQGA